MLAAALEGDSDSQPYEFDDYSERIARGQREFECPRCAATMLVLLVLPCCGRMACFACVAARYVYCGFYSQTVRLTYLQ